MSILNYWATPERAIVAVDTAGSTTSADHARGQVSKLIPLPHANVVLASRGSIDIFAGVLQGLHVRAGLDFDSLASFLPENLPSYIAWMLDYMAKNDIHGTSPDIQLALVGWSPARHQIEARLFRSDAAECSVSAQGSCFAPGEAPIDLTRIGEEPFSHGEMLDLMRKQVQWAKDGENGGEGFGGRMVHVEILPDQMIITTGGKLD